MKLSDSEIRLKLNELKNWNIIEGKLTKICKLKDFMDALSYVLKIGVISEKIDHHPDIRIFEWNKVEITIFTHSLSCLTDKDFELAKLIDQI